MRISMKQFAVAALATAIAGGAAAAPRLANPDEARSGKEQLRQVSYTYQQCLIDTFALCGDLYPDDLEARFQCINERRDTICATLPGAP